MEPVTTAALIAGGASLVGSGTNAWAQGKMNRKTREFSREMYDKQRAASLADWDKTNSYNSPAQQMQRLREAGLNPHLVYSNGGGVQTASTIPQTEQKMPQQITPNIGAMLTDPVNAYIETRRFAGQQKLLNAQILKTLAEVDTKNFDLSQKSLLAQTTASIAKEILVGKEISNAAMADENARKNDLHPANMELLDLQVRRTMQDLSQSSQNHNMDLLQKSLNRQKTAIDIANAYVDNAIKKLEVKLKNGEITKQYYEKETNKLDQQLKYATFKLTQANTNKTEDPESLLDYINSFFGIGKAFIK